MILGNLKQIFSSKSGIIGFLIGLIIMLIPTYFFTWKEGHQMKMGMGDNYFYFVLGLDIFLAILFAIFIGGTIYKMLYFGNRKPSKLGFLGGLLGALVSGCASCSLTLATVLGLGAFMSFLPFGGLEIKIISILLLIYVCFTTLKNLGVCNIRLKKS